MVRARSLIAKVEKPTGGQVESQQIVQALARRWNMMRFSRWFEYGNPNIILFYTEVKHSPWKETNLKGK